MTKRDFSPTHPGEILLEDFLQPMQISQYHLAQAVGLSFRPQDLLGSNLSCHRA